MLRNWMKLGAVPVLAAALWFAGCSDQAPSADRLTGPSAGASLETSESGQGNGGEGGRQVKSLSRFKTVLGSVPDGSVLADSAWIGAAGGTLSAAGYELFVPGGAVNRLTKFKMVAKTDGSIGVDLTATRTDSKGREIDVGAAGFRKPVTLGLYYGWSTEQITDESKLLIVWVREDGILVPQRSDVSPEYKRVFAYLQHFSDYALAFP